MRANSRSRWKYPVGLGLAVLTVAAVVIPTVATAGRGAAAPAAATHDHAMAGHSMAGHDMTALEAAGLEDELGQVRQATARFHDLDAALAAGYELGWVNGSRTRIITGCIAHPTAGAMGYHYFQPELMADLTTDALEPEVLVYAPGENGKLKLAAVEWVVRGPQSNPPGVPAGAPPPTVLGMDMHILVPFPGPDFYITHAWIWKPNPAGMFADWNPEVSCS
jgi:hypothetical protein